MSSDRAMKYSPIIAAAIPILLAVATITNVETVTENLTIRYVLEKRVQME